MLRIEYLHLEISSLCNAACPSCPRYFNNSRIPNPWVKQSYMSYENYRKFFPPEILNITEVLNFCGNFGDPVTNPDLLKIVQYTAENLKGYLEIHTNGGMHLPSTWEKIGKVFKEKRDSRWVVVFSIDGLSDTNHIYRRNVKWNKLQENFLSFNKAGGKSIWEYLVFRHNEHQLDEATKLAKEYGFEQIRFKNALNLDNGEHFITIPAMNVDGNVDYHIYPPEQEKYRTSVPSSTRVVESDFSFNPNSSFKKDLRYVGGEEEIPTLESIEIVPRCKDHFYVDANGNVFPCCHTGIILGKIEEKNGKFNYRTYKDKQLHEAYLDYGIENLNLYTAELSSIVKNRILDSIYSSKWNKTIREGKQIRCIDTCGKKNSLTCVYNEERNKELL